MDYYFTICFLPNLLVGPAPPCSCTPQRGTFRGKRGSGARRALGGANAAVNEETASLPVAHYVPDDAGGFAKISSATGVFARYPRFRLPTVDQSSGLSDPGSPDDPPSALVSQGQ